tara:strand:- start:220 stop:399 length:180 start_codon:yes stop_codon:yes gene_type:complete
MDKTLEELEVELAKAVDRAGASSRACDMASARVLARAEAWATVDSLEAEREALKEQDRR